MSRTFKDRPSKLIWGDYSQDYVYLENYSHIFRKTTKPKLRKEVDTEDHWMTTPSWWTKMMMIRPERRAAHLLEVAALKTADIEDVDFPDLGKKPHIYYW